MKDIFFCQAPSNIPYILNIIDENKLEDFCLVLPAHLDNIFAFFERALSNRKHCIINIKTESVLHFYNPIKLKKELKKIKKEYTYKFKNISGKQIHFFEKNFDFISFYLIKRLASKNQVTYYHLDNRMFPESCSFFYKLKACYFSFIIYAPMKFVIQGERRIPSLNIKKIKNISTIIWKDQTAIITTLNTYSTIFEKELKNKTIVFIDNGEETSQLFFKDYNETLSNIIKSITTVISPSQFAVKPHPRTGHSHCFKNTDFQILPDYIPIEFLVNIERLIFITVFSTSIKTIAKSGSKAISLIKLFDSFQPEWKKSFVEDFSNNKLVKLPETIKHLQEMLK
jgi:hypothetical protein